MFPIARKTLVGYVGMLRSHCQQPFQDSFGSDKKSYFKLCQEEVFNGHQWLRSDCLMHESIKVLRPLSISDVIKSLVLLARSCGRGGAPREGHLSSEVAYTIQLNSDHERIVRQVFHHISPPAE